MYKVHDGDVQRRMNSGLGHDKKRYEKLLSVEFSDGCSVLEGEWLRDTRGRSKQYLHREITRRKRRRVIASNEETIMHNPSIHSTLRAL